MQPMEQEDFVFMHKAASCKLDMPRNLQKLQRRRDATTTRFGTAASTFYPSRAVPWLSHPPLYMLVTPLHKPYGEAGSCLD